MSSKEAKAPRITIAEAYRRVIEIINADTSMRFPDSIDVYVRDGPGVDASLADGKIPEDSELHVEVNNGKALAIKNLRAVFHAFCTAESVNPRPLNMPWGGPPFSGSRIDEYEYDISIEEYERWAAPYRQMTTHLKIDADPQESNLTTPPGAKSVSSIPWDERARQIADKFHLRDRAAGVFSGVKDMSERVADAMRAEGTEGPRGPLSWATIKRDALQGDLWNKKRPTLKKQVAQLLGAGEPGEAGELGESPDA